ncbi:MAG: metallophosphoesterase, partial [Clostridia bacterium]|nr:metallophosphoesterase [Clostridia bacterium]
MNSEIINIKQRKKRIWKSFVTVLASIVVFVTTYALIIPAITWERTLICEIPEHTHSESCYSDGELVCTKVEHVHTAACFDAPKAAAKLYICGKTEHTHTEDCYFDDGTLRCTLEEHKHSSFCMALTASKSAPAAQKSTVILACSDVQDPANSWLFLNGSSLGDYTNQTKLLNNIISQVKKVYPTIDGFFCGGDYNFDVTREGRQYLENGVNKTYTSALALSRTQQDVKIFSDAIKSFIPTLDNDKITLIQGNHDVLCDGLTKTGGYDKGAYAVYVINEQDYPSGNTASQSLCQKTADGLRMWLQSLVSVKYDKPVFILSHVPLHYSTRTIIDGDAVYAQLLYDAIESYGSKLNIIFLYGHDHAHGDDDYLGGSSQFLTRGDKITVAQSGNRTGSLEKTLNFTYMNYGFVGYFWDTWGQQSGTINRNTDYTLTMTTFEINGSDVIIRRWDENGQHILKAAGAASQGDRGIADPLAPNTKTYASPQLVRSPKSNSSQTISYFELTDKGTNVTVRAFGSSYSVVKVTNLQALKNAGITDYLAYDITVQDFAGSAQITMPSKSGYNKVWCVKDDGTLEVVEDARFNGNSVTFTATHFSIYANGVEVPLNDGDRYLVKTPASELRPGDSVLVLSNDESVILYPGEDHAWPDTGPIPSAYTEYYGGVLESIEYNGKTYYPYDANLQDYCSESALTVTSSMGLKNCNGKILDLNFNADNWDQTFFQSGGAVINADGTITQTIGGTKHYLTFNPATDAWLSFRSSTSNSQYAQLVFYRLEQFEAPEPEDDEYQIVD